MASETQVLMGLFAGIILLTTFLFNFMTKGFLFTFLWVKMSKGKRVLVKVFSLTDSYYRSGTLDGDMLRYKDRNKNKKLVAVSKDALFQNFGVFCLMLDEEKNAVVNVKKMIEAVPGFDAVKYENILQRALTRPTVGDQKGLWILIGVGICILGIGFVAFKQTQMMEIVIQIAQQVVPATPPGQGGVI